MPADFHQQQLHLDKDIMDMNIDIMDMATNNDSSDRMMQQWQSDPLMIHRYLQGQPQQQQPQPQYYQNQQQQQQLPPQQPGFAYDQTPQNGEQSFYNDVMGSFQGFAGGEINGAIDVDVSDAMTSFGVNLILFFVLFGGYEVVSRLVPSVYAGRKLHVSDDRMAIDIPRSFLPFSWIVPVLRTSWTTVRKCGGLDAYFFLRFIQMCLKITAVSGLWGMIILWPVFASGGGGAVGWYHFSMANVMTGSSLIWVPTVFMWLLTFYVLFVMSEEYKHYLDLRMQYLAEGDVDMNPQTQHLLIVEEIPRELRSDRALYQYFDTLYPGKIHSASVVLNIPDLEKIAAKRKRAVRRLEKSNAYFEATGKRGTHVVGRKRFRCCGVETFPILSFGGKMSEDHDDFRSNQKGQRVDSISYYKQQLSDFNESVENLQRQKKLMAEEGNDTTRAHVWISNIISMASDAAAISLTRNTNEDGPILGFKKSSSPCGLFKQVAVDFLFGGISFFTRRNIDLVVDTVSRSALSSTGFVTFNDMATVVSAARSPLSHDPDVLKVSIAPDPRDIIWKNAHINASYSKGREWTANLVLGLVAILWSSVVASIQAWATFDHMSNVIGSQWMSSSLDVNPKFSSFVNGYLPVVALLGIISILPLIFQGFAQKFESRKTKTDVQDSMLGRYFYYQLANIYVTVTAGSIWTSLGEVMDHPGSIFDILGNSMPNLVGFFVTLLATKTLAGLPIVILRPVALLRKLVLRLIFRQKYLSQRELNEVYKRETLLGGWQYPNLLFVVVICFTYACISPIILPFGALFFFMSLIVYKKQVLLVYAPEHESGGTMFPSACVRTLIGLICGQVTMIGYTILRSSFYQPLALLPLPFITYVMMQSFDRIYTVPSSLLSLERACQLDQYCMAKIRFDENLYRQPVMAEARLEPLPYRVSEHNSPRMGSSSISPLGVLNEDSGKIV